MASPALTPAESSALHALELRKDWPKLTGKRAHGSDTDPSGIYWYVNLYRADGKLTIVYGETLEKALIRAGGIAEEMAADARRREVVRA